MSAVEELEKPAEATPEVTAPAPTPEELEQSRQEFMAGFGFASPTEKKPEPAKEEKKEPEAKEEPKLEEAKKPDEKKESAPEPEKQKKPKQKKSELVRQEPEPSSQEAIDEDALADRIVDRMHAKANPAPETIDDADLDPEEKATLAALERLSKESKYAGRDLVKETKAFWKREEDYAQKWEAENPGETFDPEAQDHKAFYARNQPKYVPKDLEFAKEQVKKDELRREIEEQVKQKVDPELEQLRAREEFRRAQPEIDRATHGATAELVVAAVPEFKDLLTDQEGNLVITQNSLDKMQEANPEAVELLNEEALSLKAKISELEKLSRLGQYYQADLAKKVRLPNGEVVMPHQEIMDAGMELEETISKQPKADQIVEGRQFITRAQLHAEQTVILNSKASDEVKQARLEALQNRVWYVEPAHIRQRLVNKSAAKVAKVLKVAEKIRDRHAANLAKAAENEKASKATERKAIKAPPVAPAIVAASDNVDTAKRSTSSEEQNLKEIDQAFFN